MGKKFVPDSGLKLSEFRALANEQARPNAKKKTIREIYKLFRNFEFFNLYSDDENKNKKLEKLKNDMLEKLKKLINNKMALEMKTDTYNSRKCCNDLLEIRKKLKETIEHIDKKLAETRGEKKEYKKFRVKGSIRKLFEKAFWSGNIAVAIADIDTEDIERETVEDVSEVLVNFSSLVDKNIEKIIEYNPLLKVKDMIENLKNIEKENMKKVDKKLNQVNVGTAALEIISKIKAKFEEFERNQKKVNEDEEKIKKLVDDIKEHVINPWKDNYKEACRKFKTLETERTFTRFLRKAVKIGGRIASTWIGPALCALVGGAVAGKMTGKF